MTDEDIRTCIETAAGLLTSRAAGNEAAWQAAWDRVAHEVGRAQLTMYLLCRTVDDAPERVDRTGSWSGPYTAVGREIGRKPEGRIAAELIGAARLLGTCGIDGDWRTAWDEVDDDVRRSLADAVLRTWRTAIPAERPAMRALLRSIGAAGARRRIRRTTGYYRGLPGNLWRIMNGAAPLPPRARLERARHALRRSRTYDRPAIPEFDRIPLPRTAARWAA